MTDENSEVQGYKAIRNEYKIEAGMKTRQLSYCFEKNTPSKDQENAFKIAQEFTNNYLNNTLDIKGLLFIGGVGSGKTYITSCIFSMIIDNVKLTKEDIRNFDLVGTFYLPRLHINFISTVELMEKLRSNYNYSSKDKTPQYIVNDLKDSHLLILDDLGAEKNTEWVNERLFEIIDYRYNENLPLVVTSNCTPEELKQKIGDRNYDRLREMCLLVPVTAKSQRKTAAT